MMHHNCRCLRESGDPQKQEKGEVIVSHVLGIGIAVLLVIGIMVAFNSFRLQQSAEVARLQLESICYQIKSSAEALWRPSSYRTNATAVMGRMALNLPPKAGGHAYLVRMSGNEISVTAPDAASSASCRTGIATLSGSSAGGAAELTFTMEADTNKIELR